MQCEESDRQMLTEDDAKKIESALKKGASEVVVKLEKGQPVILAVHRKRI